jgi:hypothetical protein
MLSGGPAALSAKALMRRAAPRVNCRSQKHRVRKHRVRMRLPSADTTKIAARFARDQPRSGKVRSGQRRGCLHRSTTCPPHACIVSQAKNASSILVTRSTSENRCNRCGSTDSNRGARCSGPSGLSAGGKRPHALTSAHTFRFQIALSFSY